MHRYVFRLNPLMILVLLAFLCAYGGSAKAQAGGWPAGEDWCCDDYVGDIDQSGAIDITDLSVLIDNMFLTLTPLPCWGEADFNADYIVDITDLQVFLWASQFCEGPGPGGTCIPFCSPPPPSGSMTGQTGCKTWPATNATDPVTADQSCITWEYDGNSRLTIRHVNAGLNCCPEGTAEVTVSDGLITVDERGIDGVCDCYCLYDLDLLVVNLPPGEYGFFVYENISGVPSGSFEFTVDLIASPTGMVCVDRPDYPWGTF
jgi:hypothetical protein